MEEWTRPDGVVMNVHSAEGCGPLACVIHNPKPSVMDEFPLHWRGDRGIFERICPHGIGHPDPSQFDYWDAEYGEEAWAMSVHGCDGCCS